jgi:hypothetical protein
MNARAENIAGADYSNTVGFAVKSSLGKLYRRLAEVCSEDPLAA